MMEKEKTQQLNEIKAKVKNNPALKKSIEEKLKYVNKPIKK